MSTKIWHKVCPKENFFWEVVPKCQVSWIKAEQNKVILKRWKYTPMLPLLMKVRSAVRLHVLKKGIIYHIFIDNDDICIDLNDWDFQKQKHTRRSSCLFSVYLSLEWARLSLSFQGQKSWSMEKSKQSLTLSFRPTLSSINDGHPWPILERLWNQGSLLLTLRKGRVKILHKWWI